MRNYKLILIPLIALLSACSLFQQEPDEPTPDPAWEMETLEGQVQFPLDMPSIDSVTIQSIFDEKVPSPTGAFQVEVPNTNEPNLLFVSTEGSEKIHMIGYDFGVDAPYEINATSTAIALVMMSPWSWDLTSEARVQAVDRLKTHPNFPALVTEVERIILEGQGLFASEHPGLMNMLESFVENGVFKSDRSAGAVKMTPEGGKVRMSNEKAIAYGIGVYDAQGQPILQKPIVLEAANWVNLSIVDFIAFQFTNASQRDRTVLYDFPQDGSYTFKANSGRSLFYGSGANASPEAIAARNENLLLLFGRFVGVFLPAVQDQLFENKACLGSIVTKFINNFELAKSATDIQTNYELVKLIATIFKNQAEDYANIIVDCTDVPEGSRFKKYLKLVGKFVDVTARVENGANAGKIAYDLYSAPEEIEFCFTKSQNQVENCTFEITAFSGNFTEYNTCTIDFGDPGSVFENTLTYTIPPNLTLDRVRVQWFFFACQGNNGEGNTGAFFDVLDTDDGQTAVFTDCFRYATCGRVKNVLTLIASDGTESTPYELEIPYPGNGANKSEINGEAIVRN